MSVDQSDHPTKVKQMKSWHISSFLQGKIKLAWFSFVWQEGIQYKNMVVISREYFFFTFSWNKRFTPHKFFRCINKELLNQSGPNWVLDMENLNWGFFTSWINILHIISRQWRADNNASLDDASIADFAQSSEAETSTELMRIWTRLWSFTNKLGIANAPAVQKKSI